MKIVAFGASTSSKSINKQLAQYAGELATEIKTGIDLEDYEIPLFSQDKEAELGQPEAARAFFDKLGASDAIIISFAEHNGSYSAAYKNLFDWTSRINQKLFQNKPMILLSTSPGPGGAANVLTAAIGSAPYFAGDVKASLSVPSFFENFDVEQAKLTNAALALQLKTAVQNLLA
jgi:chromate reductase